MLKQIRPAFVLLVLMTVITGGAYPLLVTAVAQLAFAEQANGSLVRDASGQVRGSSLLAQRFEGAQWFHPRPSTGGYETVASGASNLAPSNPELADQVRARVIEWAGSPTKPVPMELVTTSASGLDPHLTLVAARFQASLVAAARGIQPERVERLLLEHLEAPLVGPAVVNVLALNLALADNRLPAPSE